MKSSQKENPTNSSLNISKTEIKENLNNILKNMNNEYPLSQLCEYVEKETGGKFSFLTFREIIDNLYPDIQREDKIYLLKYISLSSLGINEKSPLISLLSLFSFFEKILNEKILSPSLIFYKVGEIIEKKYNLSTLELIYKFNLTLETEVNDIEFYTSFSQKLLLDEMTSIVLFNGIDYKKKRKIKIEDLVLVIDSYRDNYLEENKIDDDSIKKAQILKMFMDKNFITIDQLFEGSEYNYLYYDELKSRIMKEIKLAQNNFTENEPINESIVDNVLTHLSKNDKIFKDSFEKYFPKDNKNSDLNNEIILSDLQKYWINKFLDFLSLVSITPKMIFESSLNKYKTNIINLEDLKRQLKIILPNGRISNDEAESIMNSLDINKNRLLEINQYENIINQVLKYKKNFRIMNNNFINNNEGVNIKNIWARGIKSINYHLLPVKGNFQVLEKLRNECEKKIFYDMSNKENDKNLENVGFNFKIENNIQGDNAENDQIITNNIKKNTNDSSNLKNNNIKSNSFPIEEYEDEYFLIEALEKFKTEKNYFPCFDLFNDLIINNSQSREKMSQFIKFLDNDLDGFISLLDLMSFLLHFYKHRSTKILLRFLYNTIYNDFKMESTDDFFIKNNIDLYKEIYVNDLCKFLNNLNIEFPISKKLFDEMKMIFPSPVTYNNLGELINENKDKDKYNNYFKTKSHIIDMKYLEDGIKRIIYGIIDDDNFINTRYLKAKNFRENLKTILDICDDKMNLNQYNENFIRPMKIEPEISLTIFQLLKTISNEGEQLIYKNDLISFLESYIDDGENLLLKNDGINNEENTRNILIYLEKNGPPLKYALEKIPFNRNGLLTINEIENTLTQFYNGILSKKQIKIIVFDIDINKKGIINYLQLESFLYEYSNDNFNKFSSILEIEFLSSNIIKLGFKNSDDYFSKFSNSIENNYNISKEEHNKILSNITSSNNNRNELFDFLCKREGKENGYSLNNLINLINGYIIESCDFEELNEKEEKEIEDEDNENFDMMPDKKLIENAMRKIKVGSKGNISLNEFYMKFPIETRKALMKNIDIEKNGFISFNDFIIRLRKIYGSDINLNYKLCAQYLYISFIKSPEKIESYILSKSECSNNDIDTYMNYNQIYSRFMFAFVNDKFLFENFYYIFKEKHGKYSNMMNLNQIVKFIQMNNDELKNVNLIKKVIKENDNIENKNDNEEVENKNEVIEKEIRMILSKKLTSIKEILEKINPKSGGIKNNYTIKEKYLKILIGAQFNFSEDDSETFINYFNMEEGRTNIKKLYNFDPSIKRDREIYLSSEVISKIKEHILNTPFKSYKIYKNKIFQKNKLDLSETALLFQQIYNISLFGTLLSINNEMYLSIDNFFKENQLKDFFPQKEFDPVTKLALSKLSEYFQSKKDKLKLFKLYDTNKDGFLSPDEFITVLNSFKDLQLNDSQKIQILKIADKNQDGKINANEFLSFIKSIKDIDKLENEISSQKKNQLPKIQSISNSNSMNNMKKQKNRD